jgi:hypothetical protein
MSTSANMETQGKIFTDDDVRALQERNRARVKELIAAMGDKYLLHPQNRIARQKNQRPGTENAGQAN